MYKKSNDKQKPGIGWNQATQDLIKIKKIFDWKQTTAMVTTTKKGITRSLMVDCC